MNVVACVECGQQVHRAHRRTRAMCSRCRTGLPSGGPPAERGDLLRVSCWCEERIVLVPRHLIGTTTRSCGLPGCEAPA